MNETITTESPIYSLKVISGNPYETYVNNLVVEKDYDEGTTDHELLINEYILSSGDQKIGVTLLPNQGEEYIDKLSLEYFKLQIFIYEKGWLDYEKNNKKLVKELKIPATEKQLPLIKYEWKFLANVPYKNTGWINSVKLTNENQEKLNKEVLEFYEKQRTILDKGDYNQYLKILEKRDNEVFGSIYATEKIMKDDKEYMTNRILKSKGNMEVLKDFHMVFYAEGKVVTLELKNGKSPLYASNKTTLFRYRLLIHRPKKGEPLEVIR